MQIQTKGDCSIIPVKYLLVRVRSKMTRVTPKDFLTIFSHNNRNSKNKWNNNNAHNAQHPANSAQRSQTIPPTTQPSTNYHNANNNTSHPTPSATNNSFKPIELVVHDEVSVNHMHDRMLYLLSNFVVSKDFLHFIEIFFFNNQFDLPSFLFV